MEKIIVLGTGSGITINCYSLSALLENNNEGNYLLIDTGSGNQILNHLKMKNIDTELSALTTEYDTVKNLISKNVEKVFTMFST